MAGIYMCKDYHPQIVIWMSSKGQGQKQIYLEKQYTILHELAMITKALSSKIYEILHAEKRWKKNFLYQKSFPFKQ